MSCNSDTTHFSVRRRYSLDIWGNPRAAGDAAGCVVRTQPKISFDGDTGSLVYLMDSTSIEECKAALYSRQSWISPSGALRASMGYDTTEYMLAYLTGEPEVRPT